MIQIAKTMGVKTVNVVRDRSANINVSITPHFNSNHFKTNHREDMGELRSQLESMGADLVLTEEEMRSTKVIGCLVFLMEYVGEAKMRTELFRYGSQVSCQNLSWASTVLEVLVGLNFAR